MTRTRAKPAQAQTATTSTTSTAPVTAEEVLTLAEAATYLRVAESALRQMLSQQAIPGQKIGLEWRFLKAALQDWLRSPPAVSANGFWETQAGAFKDDPCLEDIVREAYRKRGRPMTEEG